MENTEIRLSIESANELADLIERLANGDAVSLSGGGEVAYIPVYQGIWREGPVHEEMSFLPWAYQPPGRCPITRVSGRDVLNRLLREVGAIWVNLDALSIKSAYPGREAEKGKNTWTT